jgi:AcrR family transcriptional regulator
VTPMLSHEARRQHILQTAAEQFAATGFSSTTMVTLAKAAGLSEAVLQRHFRTKRKLFQEVVRRNSKDRLRALQDRFFAIPDSEPVECIESMAESTILACVDVAGNASVMACALMEELEFAADVYRLEIGATQALWDNEIATRLADSPFRTWIAVHLVPYAVRVCMAFGFWLAALRHTPATAREHARQFTTGIVDVARALLSLPVEPLQPAPPVLAQQREALR